MEPIQPISTWMLSRIAAYDVHSGGFAGQYLRASAERRHVIAAYCSAREFDSNKAAEEATFLATARHSHILYAAYGSVPSGLRGALRRMPSGQQDVQVYPLLYELLSKPLHDRMARTIQRLSTIDYVSLRIVRKLPDKLCDPVIVTSLGTERQARALLRIVPRMIAVGADEGGLIRALRSVRESAIEDVIRRWCMKLPFPPGPVPPSTLLVPVEYGRTLSRVALRFRNCIRSYLAAVLDGTAAFAEYLHHDGPVLIHFVRRDGVWYVEGVHAHRNRPVPDHVREAAEDYCKQRGVGARMIPGRPSNDWSMLADTGWRFAG